MKTRVDIIQVSIVNKFRIHLLRAVQLFMIWFDRSVVNLVDMEYLF